MLPLCAHARVTVAPAGGVAWATLKRQLPGGSAGVGTWRAGVRFEKRITSHWYLQPSLFYTKYGYSTTYTGSTIDYFTNSVDAPVMLLFKTGMPCEPRFIFGGGALLVKQFDAYSKMEGNRSVARFSPSRSGLGTGYALTAGFEMPSGVTFNTSYHFVRLGYVVTPGVYDYRQISFTLGYIISKVDRR